MAGSNASSLTSSRLSGRRDPMLQPQFIRSSTFHWTLAVAGVLAVFVIGLFGFIYWSVDDYLITRSDTMIARQLDFIAGLPGERQLDAIDHNLKQDTRGVHYAALFGADGRKIAGNMGQLPPELGTNDIVRNVPIIRTLPTGRQARVIRAIARRMPGGNTLVIGREVDETREISHVVGQALALGLLPGLCLCLLAGAWLSMRAQKRVEEVNKRVQRIIAGDLRERLPHRNVDEPFSKLAVIVNGMLDEMETMIHALAGVGNDIAHDLRTPLTRARLALERRTHQRNDGRAAPDGCRQGDRKYRSVAGHHHSAVASCRDRKQPAVGRLWQRALARNAARGLRPVRADRGEQERRFASRGETPP